MPQDALRSPNRVVVLRGMLYRVVVHFESHNSDQFTVFFFALPFYTHSLLYNIIYYHLLTNDSIYSNVIILDSYNNSNHSNDNNNHIKRQRSYMSGNCRNTVQPSLNSSFSPGAFSKQRAPILAEISHALRR